MQIRGKTVVPLLAIGIFIVAQASTFTFSAQAGDKSGVLKASDLIGMRVQGTDGTHLGNIKDLVIDPAEGGVDYAVLGFGGFAGIGDKYLAVPWEALLLDQANKKLLLDVRKKDLKNAPGFDKNNWPDLSLDEVLIYEFYAVPQPGVERSVRAKRSKAVTKGGVERK